jgi:hypothetical protein
MGASCFTHRFRRTPVPKGFKLPHNQQKYDGSQEPQSWLLDYLQAVKILGGLKENSNTKLAVTPHRRGMVMARQVRQGDNWKLGQTRKTVHKQFQFDLQEASVNRRS